MMTRVRIVLELTSHLDCEAFRALMIKAWPDNKSHIDKMSDGEFSQFVARLKMLLAQKETNDKGNGNDGNSPHDPLL